MERIIRINRTERRTRIGYMVALLLLITAYFFTYSNNRKLISQAALVSHTNEVINTLEALISTIKDAETGVRGYLITGKTEFLTPYYGSVDKIDSLYYNVKNLTSDNPLQQERLTRFRRNLDIRMDLLKMGLDYFDSTHTIINDTSIQVQSRKAMDICRAEVAMMQQEEARILAIRDQRLKKTFGTIDIVTSITVVLALVLTVISFLTYQKESRARKKTIYEVWEHQEELKKRVEQLNMANAELIRMRSQEKFAATGRIARTIAHEVRNPLTNINLAADQLKSDHISEDENSAFLFDMIQRNSNRINQLISDLLNSTKFAELSFEKLHINDLMDTVLKDAEDRIKLANIKVVRKYSNDICHIMVDKEKIKIAFLNIVINAVEAMEGKPDGQLTIETKTENNKCKIVISDNGVGMDEEALVRLFEPYFTSKSNGNGLGLTNTQNIILNHKGEISVQSGKNKGTSFTITLDFS
jgi:signal transduction histidine kinase